MPHSLSHIEAVVFDFDGTLVDTLTGDYLACCDLFEENGLALDAAHWVRTVGGNVAAYSILFGEVLEALASRAAIAPTSVHHVSHDSLQARLQHLWSVRMTPECVGMMPGALAFLQHLHTQGIPMAVATAAPRDWAQTWLDRFEVSHLFQAIESGADRPRNKPYPDVFVHAARMLGVAPAACLAFEDSTIGIEAAKAADMTVVAIPPALFPELDVTRADLRLSSMTEALQLPLPRGRRSFGSPRWYRGVRALSSTGE